MHFLHYKMLVLLINNLLSPYSENVISFLVCLTLQRYLGGCVFQRDGSWEFHTFINSAECITYLI